MSKLGDFLESKKIDPRRVVATSKRIERQGPDDKAIRLAKRRTKKGSASDTEKELAKTKGRSGKAVTTPLLARAIKGDTVSGPAKTRIVRAVNEVLKVKKQDEVAVRDLF